MAATVSLFGVVIPGRPVITDFQPVSESKAVSIIQSPSTVAEITFFLLPTSPCPPGFGAVLYFSIDQVNWQILGAISPEKPSGTFRTGWPSNEIVCNAPFIYLGVSLETLDVILNLQIENSGFEDRFNFAHKIALDLFEYMTSFSQTSTPGTMMVPTNIFDRWFERFERKYRLDPNFMLKKSV